MSLGRQQALGCAAGRHGTADGSAEPLGRKQPGRGPGILGAAPGSRGRRPSKAVSMGMDGVGGWRPGLIFRCAAGGVLPDRMSCRPSNLVSREKRFGGRDGLGFRTDL